MSDTGVYVYAIARDLPGDVAEGVRGVAGAPVRILDCGDLSAIASEVDLADFGEEGLRRHLEDLDWLESTARAHHAVVDAAGARATIVPLGLATVYRSEERVREALGSRSEEFARAVERITDRTEWGVKAYAESARTPEPAGPDTAEASGGRPGTSYLRRRRAQQETREASRRDVLVAASRVDGELREIAVAGRLHRLQDPRLSGERGTMILNAAYLVDNERTDEFRDAVARLAGLRSEIRVQLTGPWAPYSFATEEEEWTAP